MQTAPIQSTEKDPYPTRKPKVPKLIERRDPVVYGSPKTGPLAAPQLKDFSDQGFLFFPGMLSTKELSPLISAYGKLQGCAQDDDPRFVLEPNGRNLRSVFELDKLDARFQEIAESPRILDVVHQLLGQNVYLLQSRINCKKEFSGQSFSWHSDFETWHAEDGLPRMKTVSVAIFLDDNHEFNGPLVVVPGTHKVFLPSRDGTPKDNYKQSLKQQTVGVPQRDILQRVLKQSDMKAPKGSAGSVLVFDCNILHTSAPNISADPRANLYFVYNTVDNKLQRPFGSDRPRPEFLGRRENIAPL